MIADSLHRICTEKHVVSPASISMLSLPNASVSINYAAWNAALIGYLKLTYWQTTAFKCSRALCVIILKELLACECARLCVSGKYTCISKCFYNAKLI